VRLNGIYFYPIQNPDTEERAFRAGQLHLTEQVPLSKIEHYQKESRELIRIDPYLGNYFYRINTTTPHLKDKRVRLALNLAIDRESLVKNVTKGGQIPAYNFTPPGTAGYTSRSQITGNVAIARQLLADAGYPEGKGLPPVEILYNTSENHKIIAEAVQQMWKSNLGIDAQLVNQEWKVYLDSQRTKNYQLARSGWIGDYVDPNTFLDVWVTDGANNETGWSNAGYDRLIREAGQTGDPAKRYELFQQAEAILVADPPFVPIYFYTRVHLIQPSVKGWHPNILDNHPYKHVYLEASGK
jgi:oligopeptide transport system substrate-binding protein